MNLFQLVTILLSMMSHVATAWIQMIGNSRKRNKKHIIHLHDKNRVDIESLISNDVKTVSRVSRSSKGRLIHIPGLFESLSSLPVHNWADPSFDDMVCRDDDCDTECEIPDDWKGSTVHTDVLGFLGIKRAEPLNIRKRLQ